MTTLRTAVGQYFTLTKHKGDFGIEIETEVKKLEDYPDSFFRSNKDGMTVPPFSDWIVHSDGSLRNVGYEFVFDRPKTFEESIKALDVFAEGTREIKFLKNAPATSVHVHVNMADEELIVLANFLTLWSMFESILVNYSGETRRSNLFALPLRVAEGNLVYMKKVIDWAGRNPMMFPASDNGAKYSALNIARLSIFGSLEIRSFRGETDINEIKRWLSIINQVRMFAKIPGMTPTKIMEEVKENRYEFIEKVFDKFTSSIRMTVPETNFLFDKNLWYGMIMATVVEDWEEFNRGTEIKEKKPRRKFPGSLTVTTITPDLLVAPISEATVAEYESGFTITETEETEEDSYDDFDD